MCIRDRYTTEKPPAHYRWQMAGSKYETPITFSVSIGKTCGCLLYTSRSGRRRFNFQWIKKSSTKFWITGLFRERLLQKWSRHQFRRNPYTSRKGVTGINPIWVYNFSYCWNREGMRDRNEVGNSRRYGLKIRILRRKAQLNQQHILLPFG